jgi:hypothetical protein
MLEMIADTINQEFYKQETFLSTFIKFKKQIKSQRQKKRV